MLIFCFRSDAAELADKLCGQVALPAPGDDETRHERDSVSDLHVPHSSRRHETAGEQRGRVRLQGNCF